ncbi:hypothetical protein [Marinilabilia salmonicolor]|uniref:Uncharacterized protein n=1 Tax=Marinilabilia salmonicolor TaxID=989 RepID=A0A368V8U8_9BACT|nr:hypothetical protein [Marinilabilia salmonicolor]RCW37532.1 hypothetical protein DFO77_10540 [Marinilabilia salmonicolor]
MPKLKKQGLKILKMIHLFFVVMWIGGAIALLTVLFFVQPESGDELFMKSRIIQLIDDFIIIPGAMGNLLIGIVYGVWTGFGFFKHHWITVKWVLTVAQILFGTFFLGPWVNGNVKLANTLREHAFSNDVFQYNFQQSAVWGTVQMLLLLVMLILSVQKPWSRVVKRNNIGN